MNSNELTKKYIKPLFTRSYWQMMGDYVGIGRQKKTEIITDVPALSEFIGSRASHVAQTSLYGYLRTRSGTRFPSLFESQDMLISINIAKWQIWLACTSDLAIYCGQYLSQSGQLDPAQTSQLTTSALQHLFDETGTPNEAGDAFAGEREKVMQRIKTNDWELARDDDSVFSASPEALFYWSPIADELKELDESIVKNSIRYRWIEIRRNVRKQLDCNALKISSS